MAQRASRIKNNNNFKIITLGCKVNQCESASIEQGLLSLGYKPVENEDNAQVVLINTCIVTHKASAQSRHAIRHAIKENPGALVVVTGCYAQRFPEELKMIEGVHIIAGNTMKYKIPNIIRNRRPGNWQEVFAEDFHEDTEFFPQSPSCAPTRTRAFLKIQDGCDAFCSYCIVPFSRGPIRSMPPDNVISMLKTLSDKGYKEVVLTGIHLGKYGYDLNDWINLVHLLKEIGKQNLPIRIRLSSLEPQEIGRELIEMVANNGWLCPHFHIPLQSGDNYILKLMNREYSKDDFKDLIHWIKESIPHAGIGVDVMAGFPGETESAFENTYNLLKELPISYLHVFPFSPRKGTMAEKLPNKIHPEIIKKRAMELRRLGNRKKSDFYISCIGLELEVLSLGDYEGLNGYSKGLSENYLKVIFPRKEPDENTIFKIHMDQKTGDYMEGHIVSKVSV